MKIHFLSNSLKTNSGFAIVTKNLAQELKKLGHTITMSGLQTATTPEFTYGIECLPMATHTDEMTQFRNNLIQINPDVVIYVGEMYTDLRHLTKIFPRTIVYPPIEGIGIPNYMVRDLNQIATNGGRVVAQCVYGFNEMIKADIQATGYIYHGYNEKIFKPLEKSELTNRYCFYTTEMGKELIDPKILCKHNCYNCSLLVTDQLFCSNFKDELVTFCKYMNNKWTEINDLPMYKLKEQFSNKFIFLFVGQNHLLRKKINRLLIAFSILLDSKQMKDRIQLHLHTNPQSSTGLDLLELCNRLNIQDNVSFSYGTWRSSGWSENALSILYNLADVHVSATSSEGYGLCHLESMACGIPNISPDCTSLTELIGTNKDDQRGILAKINDSDMIIDMTSRQLVDISDLSTKMKEIYINKELRETCSKNCLKFVQPHTWENITKKWNKLIRGMK
jgi:glycosyltransferase involved in cell wall biosynthesis